MQSLSFVHAVHAAAPLELLALLELLLEPPLLPPLVVLPLLVLPLLRVDVPELLATPPLRPLPLELAEPLPLLAPTPPLLAPTPGLAPPSPFGPQSHCPKLLPSLAHTCAPLHAPGPKHACVCPGVHASVTGLVLPLHPAPGSAVTIASAAAMPSRVRPTALDSAIEPALAQGRA